MFHQRNFPLLIVERIDGESKLRTRNRNTRLCQLGLENELKTPLSPFMKPD